MTDTQNIALIDMDGTVADYDGALRANLQAMRSPTEPLLTPSDFVRHDEPMWMTVRRKAITGFPGFWRGLPELELGMMLVELIKKMGMRTCILTKGPPNRSSFAWAEKVEWCREHLPGSDIVITEDKGLVYGKLLVDDWPEYIEAWLRNRPRGVVLVPAQGWNENIEAMDPTRILRVDFGRLPEAAKIIRAVSTRESGEPINVQQVLR